MASGHVGGFNDPLMDCKACKARFRADKLIEDFTGGEETGDGWSNEQLEAYIAEHDIPSPPGMRQKGFHRDPSIQPHVQNPSGRE